MSEFATATGIIFYEVIEPAEPILQPQTLTLLHNFMSTGRTAWGPLIDKLSQRFRLLLPDLPGHGHSHGYPAHFDYGVIAAQLAALMATENALAGHLAGCSAGGMIAQRLVAEEYMEPASLTLVSTTYSTALNLSGTAQALKAENFRAGNRWMEITAQLHDPHHYAGYYREVLLAGFGKMTPATSIDLPLTTLQRWQMPVCLIQGAADEFFPPVIVEEMAAALPNAELHIIPNQPHALIFRQPWKVAELMTTFFERIL
ncbi:MAG: alpha/beta hydrolase [Caldilineaceae bacterium]|nr:alpha/beta hydrolase [Caldilineaceae bacterium]